MAGVETKEEMLARWWATWWEEDFSWDGLARRSRFKSWQGWSVVSGADGSEYVVRSDTGRAYGADEDAEPVSPARGTGTRDAGLQDYWRADPETGRLRTDDQMGDELVRIDGRPVFHRVHLPLLWQDGTPTGKVDWADDALDKLVGSRLIAARETSFEGPLFNRTLVGADARAQFGGCVFLRAPTNPQGEGAPLSVRYELAHFAGDARFGSASFAGEASFDGASFAGDAYFGGASFAGVASFDWASFAGDASFVRASFAGVARFDRASFSRDASFHSASFAGDARFDEASFAGHAHFDSASFAGDASFDWASFAGEARFIGARFAGDASFGRASFAGVASFNGASFAGDAHFTDAKFSVGKDGQPTAGWADFTQAVFDQSAVFSGVKFHHAVSFQRAWFKRPAQFDRVSLAPEGEPWRGMFTGALFESSLDWQGSDMRAVSAFALARFDRGVLLSRDSEDVDRVNHAKALKPAVSAKAVLDPETKKIMVEEAEERRLALNALEGGAVKLKLAMEAEADHARAQRFHRLELIAARKQTKKWSVKLLSHAFGLFAGYGASIGKPLMWLMLAVLMFAGGFYGAGWIENPELMREGPYAAIWQALDFSLSNTFKPLSALSAGNEF